MIHSLVHRSALVATLLASTAITTPAFAQQSQADAATTPAVALDDAQGSDGDDIIVTGRAGTSRQRKVETSYAISTISDEDLRIRAPIGVAEALKQVPGFYSAPTSGEVSGGVRVRGIPSDGYQTVALLEDGIPVQGDPGLGWLNGDQSLRVDQSVERIEVVRGGPSAIFYSNAPGAAINFITRKGGDTLEALARYEVSSYDSHRLDGWIGGPIGATGWNFFTGGYYRLSDGPHNSGYRQDEGGQIRLNVSKDFDRGGVTFGIKRIDERVGYWGGGIYAGNAAGEPTNVAGLDNKVDNVVGPYTRYFDFLTPGGTVGFDNGVGSTVKLTQLSFQGHYDISDAFKIEQNVRYRESWTQRNSVTPYSVAAASAFLASTYGKAVGTGQSLGLFYRDSGAAFDLAGQNGNGLALVDLARTHTVPLDEFITDTRFVGKVHLLGTHNLALGVYYAREDESYQALSAAVLTDVTDHAKVLDAYLLAANGSKLYKFTDNGVVQYGAEYANASGTSDNIAVYGSDEWQITDKFRLEGGVRYEQIKTQGQVEGTKKVNLGQSATSADDSVGVGTGVFTPFSRKYDHVGWTAAANYQVRPFFGAFVRYTDTFRLPSVSSFITNANASPVVQTLNMTEGGIKYSRGKVDLYATGFRTIYNSYAISDYQRLASGLLSPVTVYGDTKTVGAEIEGIWRPTDWFDLHASWTWQRNRFSKFVYTNSAGVLTDYSHNRVIGVPDNTFRITPGVTLFDSKVRLQSDINHVGSIYTDVANQIRLPAYWSVDLSAQFTITPKLQFGLIVANVTNAFGLVNGNPRAGTIDNTEAGQSVYIGSSLYQRNFRGSLTYRF
ncbi:TonB-dependent receptor [Sphingomonas sp. PB4P5]|uniref:TonB-dependent receptor n=1 Tax=Parasphingomonas puruogangriensis TaxID=3096155 RepID=UPI002FCBFA4E